MTSVWSELKRRNVVRVAVAYAVVTWLLIEITSTVFPILRLPEWTSTFITVLLIIGFPLVMIFSWAYEVTPEGIKKEKEIDRSQSITHLTGRKLDVIIISILTIGVGYLIVEKVFWTDDVVSETQIEASSSPIDAGAKSIALLDALDALERAEEIGTIYILWQYRLIHNRIFDDVRDHPRYVALVDRVKAEMQRQRDEYRNNRAPNNQIPL